MANPLVAPEDQYLEEGYIEDQDSYIGYGPAIYWNKKEIVIPRNMLSYINPQFYMLDITEFKKHINYLESSKMGIAHDKILYHEPTTTISGTVYAKKVMVINHYTVTFENGEYRVKIYGGNHNLMDVLNLNHVQGISENSAGLIEIQSGVTGLTQSESEQLSKINSLPNTIDIWSYNDRRLSVDVGLSTEEHEQLMNTPTSQDIANKVLQVINNNGINNITDEEKTRLANTIASAVWDKELG